MAAAILAGGDSDDLLEPPCQVALISESTFECNLYEWHSGIEQLEGPPNPHFKEVAMWCQADLSAKHPQEMKRTVAGYSSDFVEGYVLAQTVLEIGAGSQHCGRIGAVGPVQVLRSVPAEQATHCVQQDRVSLQPV